MLRVHHLEKRIPRGLVQERFCGTTTSSSDSRFELKVAAIVILSGTYNTQCSKSMQIDELYGRSFQNFHETFDVFVTLFRRQSSGRVNSKHNAAPRYVTRLYNRHKMETVTNRDLRLLLKTSVFASRITHHVIAGMHTRVEKLLHRHLPIDHHFICADSRKKGATILNCNIYLE